MTTMMAEQSTLSSLQAELVEVQAQKRQAAHQEFIRGAWAGRPPKEMLELATEAGMKVEDGDKLIARIRKGKEMVALADQLQRLKKEEVETKAQYEKIRERSNAAIARLEEEKDSARIKHARVWRAMADAENAASDLLLLSDEGLLPTPHKEVTRLIERRTAEEKSHEAHAAWRKEEEARNRIRRVIEEIQYRLARLPMSRTYDRDKAELENDLKQSKHDLAAADSRVEKAHAVAEKAEKAIPSA